MTLRTNEGFAKLRSGIIQLGKDQSEVDDWLDTWGRDWIDVYPHDRLFVLCEDYIQRQVEDKWVKQGTAKIFGAVHREARRYGATFVPTLPANLRTGCAYAGIKVPKGHLRDDLSAEAHAAYFCTRGIPRPLRGWLA